MNAKQSLAIACALVCSAGMAGTTVAQAAGSSPFNALTAEQALEVDVLGVAEARGISPEAARSRLNVQKNVRPIAKQIRTQFAHRLAGIYIEHDPSHRLVVRLTGHDKVLPAFHQFGHDTLEVVFVLGAERTFAETQRLFNAGFAKLIDRVPGVQGGYVDERTGEIVIDVVRGGKAGRLADVKRSVGGYFGTPTRVEELTEPLANHAVMGSGDLDFVQSSTSTGCTSGFTVKTSTGTTTYGVTFAGHCKSDNNQYAYTGIDSATDTLTYVADKFDADSDLAWASTGTDPADVEPSFYADDFRQQEDILAKEELVAEMELCSYGRNTLYGCGLVVSNSYNPGNLCGPGVTIGAGTQACNAEFVRVDGASTLCGSLDSGGPWFSGSAAAGIHKGGGSGVCFFTSIGDLPALNLELVF